MGREEESQKWCLKTEKESAPRKRESGPLCQMLLWISQAEGGLRTGH